MALIKLVQINSDEIYKINLAVAIYYFKPILYIFIFTNISEKGEIQLRMTACNIKLSDPLFIQNLICNRHATVINIRSIGNRHTIISQNRIRISVHQQEHYYFHATLCSIHFGQ